MPRALLAVVGHGQRQRVDLVQVQVEAGGLCPRATRVVGVGVGAGGAGDAEDGAGVQLVAGVVRATSGSRWAARLRRGRGGTECAQDPADLRETPMGSL
ncbi:hypothetical protein [Streptomyces botrytidirepellens]|uniref:hypothetical protein n=1 Tax=Streptomyces botrytidirepellens TaxID=2486417 RepID=UPI0011CDE537|nr:hypothetical protein [Streptomyces botrytidirepellens]